MAPVTMKDIAIEANVSRPTVSMVLNGKKDGIRISDATRKRVLLASQRLGYRRNEIARSMVMGRTNFIGFIGDITYEYSSETLAGVVESAESRGFYVKVFSNITADSFEEKIGKVIEQRPAGVIFRSLSETQYERVSELCFSHNTPFAVVGSSFPGPKGIRVTTDDEAGAISAVEHLVSLGHSRIAFVSADRASGYVESRRAGFFKGMECAGLSVPEEYVIHNEESDLIEGLILELLALKEPPSAIFCSSDYFAMLVKRAAGKTGLNVPKDLSVVGYGNLGFAKFADPPLTTVSEPYTEMGGVAAGILIDEIEKHVKPSFESQIERKLDVELVVRGSTAEYA